MMRFKRRDFLLGAAGSGVALFPSVAPPAAERPLTCRVVDGRTGTAVPARVRLVDARGNEVVPLGHLDPTPAGMREGDVGFQSRRFAYVDGSFAIDPKWLPLKFQVIKGYSYLIAVGELHARALRDGAFTIPLARWSSLAQNGWYSGDIHIHHIAPKTCRLEMEAEDVNVANILTSDFTADRERFEGAVNACSGAKHLVYVSQEFRNDQLGHLCLLNLKKLIEPVKPMQPYHYPLHMDVCDRAHAQGGYVAWAHLPSWPGVESPLDVALEKLDGLEIMSQLDPRHLPIFMEQVVPDLAANHGLRLWYRI